VPIYVAPGELTTRISAQIYCDRADIVGIPFETTQQVCLTPLAYTIGTDFKPATRPAPDTVIDWR